MSKHGDMQALIRRYRDETGVREVDMHEMAKFAVGMGWPLPEPSSAIDRLAKEFSQAARVETRKDVKTGLSYRVNHAYFETRGEEQFTFWVDIDEAPRLPMQKSLVNRREQMVGDGLQLTVDADHWNSINPDKEPIVLPMDLTDDIEWRKNAPPDEDRKVV